MNEDGINDLPGDEPLVTAPELEDVLAGAQTQPGEGIEDPEGDGAEGEGSDLGGGSDAGAVTQDGVEPGAGANIPVDPEPSATNVAASGQQPRDYGSAIDKYADEQAQALADEFERINGYEPSDESRFGWRMQAKREAQAYLAQQTTKLNSIKKSAAAWDKAYKDRGLPDGVGTELVKLVTEQEDPSILEDPVRSRDAYYTALGRAYERQLKSGATNQVATSRTESVAGGAVPAGRVSSEDRLWVSSMEKLWNNGKKATPQQIAEWRKLGEE